MKSAIFMNGKKFDESIFTIEEAFEKMVKDNSKTLFGAKSLILKAELIRRLLALLFLMHSYLISKTKKTQIST